MNPKCGSVINFTLAPESKEQTRREDTFYQFSFWVDHNGSDRHMADLISNATATILHEKFCDKPHPSNLTASFKVKAEASFSVYQHSHSLIGPCTAMPHERSSD